MLWIVFLTFLTFCRWTLPHLIQEVNYCPMAGACVHDRHPVCGQDADGCKKRSFLDVCDMYEYNCDYGVHFQLSACDTTTTETTTTETTTTTKTTTTTETATSQETHSWERDNFPEGLQEPPVTADTATITEIITINETDETSESTETNETTTITEITTNNEINNTNETTTITEIPTHNEITKTAIPTTTETIATTQALLEKLNDIHTSSTHHEECATKCNYPWLKHKGQSWNIDRIMRESSGNVKRKKNFFKKVYT